MNITLIPRLWQDSDGSSDSDLDLSPDSDDLDDLSDDDMMLHRQKGIHSSHLLNDSEDDF